MNALWDMLSSKFEFKTQGQCWVYSRHLVSSSGMIDWFTVSKGKKRTLDSRGSQTSGLNKLQKKKKGEIIKFKTHWKKMCVMLSPPHSGTDSLTVFLSERRRSKDFSFGVWKLWKAFGPTLVFMGAHQLIFFNGRWVVVKGPDFFTSYPRVTPHQDTLEIPSSRNKTQISAPHRLLDSSWGEGWMPYWVHWQQTAYSPQWTSAEPAPTFTVHVMFVHGYAYFSKKFSRTLVARINFCQTLTAKTIWHVKFQIATWHVQLAISDRVVLSRPREGSHKCWGKNGLI